MSGIYLDTSQRSKDESRAAGRPLCSCSYRAPHETGVYTRTHSIPLHRYSGTQVPPRQLHRAWVRAYVRKPFELMCLQPDLHAPFYEADSSGRCTSLAHVALDRARCLEVRGVRHAMGHNRCLERNDRSAVREGVLHLGVDVNGRMLLECSRERGDGPCASERSGSGPEERRSATLEERHQALRIPVAGQHKM